MPVIITLKPARTEITTIGPKGDRKAQALAVAATPNPANNTLHQYNLPEASSLHPATDLKTLFPGLKLQAKQEVETQHPAELIRQYRPQPEQGDHLVIKIPGEEHQILKALAEGRLLKTFSQLSVLVHETPLYENAEPAHVTLEWLAGHGFEHEGNNTEDPDWPLWQFKRNPLQNKVDELRNQLQKIEVKCQAEAENSQALQQQLKEVEQRSSEIRRRLQEAEQKAKANQETAAKAEEEKKATETRLNKILLVEKHECQRLNAELKALQAEFATTRLQNLQTQQALVQEQAAHKAVNEALEHENQQRQALQQQQTMLTAARNELDVRVEQLEAENRALQNQVHQFEQKLTEQSSTHTALEIMQERVEYLFAQNTLQLEQAANALGQHISHTAEATARELEAGIALQHLAPGSSTTSQSGLPRSAALELASLLNNKSYDLVIAMGSGSTTQFIAEALNSAGRVRLNSSESLGVATQYVEASDNDLPKRILSFDHNRSRQKELGEKLTQAGLGSQVSLQFAPLVPANHNGKEQLFYDCGIRLQQIAHLFDSRLARILLVVNFDATEAGPEPSAALPAVLQYLSAHQLDVVVHTPAQQRLTEQWANLLDERGLEHTAPKSLGAGQVQHLTINP